MKRCLPCFILIVLHFTGYSQTQKISASFIDPYPLEITVNKTTNLVFPYPIKSVDRASADVLVQKAKYIDTVLQVKAAKHNFQETNLTVITSDGKLYSFSVHYSPSPARINYSFANNTQNLSAGSSANSMTNVDNEADFLRNSKSILPGKKFIHGVKTTQYKIRLEVEGIYIKDDNLYFELLLKNASDIPYNIEQLRFLIRDKKLGKRNSVQEIEMKPIYAYGNTHRINGQSEQKCVIVLTAFTIANSKYLMIEMSEKNGGRFIALKINDKQILKAKQ